MKIRARSDKRPYTSLGVKLVAWIVFFSTVFTLVMTITLVGLRYSDEKAKAREQLEFAASSYSKSLSNSLWEMDMVGTQLQLEALSHFPMVGHVVLTTGVGQQLHFLRGQPDTTDMQRQDILFWRENLSSPAQSDRLVGQLWLYVDESAILARLKDDALRILAVETVKGMLLGLLVIWLVSHLITRHLAHMAHDTAALLPNNLDQEIRLRRKPHKRIDELDLLCEAFNKLHLDLVQYHRQRQREVKQKGQEKLAALSSLVAGVAHEMNTPLGNSLIMASALEDKTVDILEKIKNKQLRQSELLHYLQEMEDGGKLLMSGLSKAANMVQSFKQVAIDRSTAQCRQFDLHEACHEIVDACMSHIRQHKHEIKVDIPPHITLNSYPMPLGQVLSALIENALVHAYEPGTSGTLILSASQPEPEHVMLKFADNGMGIAEDHLARVFDPFFTTKMGHGSNGLGLHICYNIVTSLLRGQIRVESTPHVGTCFIIDLPLNWEQGGHD